MKIQYASDLHLEFPSNSNYMKENPLKVTGEILILAGDIHVINHDKFMEEPFGIGLQRIINKLLLHMEIMNFIMIMIYQQ
jgi:hypothetical protein